MDWTDLAIQCGSQVSPNTIKEIIRVESSGNPIALNVNGMKVQPVLPKTAGEAAELASEWIKRGFTVDLGLTQINSRNLPHLGLTVEQVLDPCTNIRAGAQILSENYTKAVKIFGLGQKALQAALSAYNTGSFVRGFTNGYVTRYYGAVSNMPEAPNPYTVNTAVEWTDAPRF